jgi:hypothetical protein
MTFLKNTCFAALTICLIAMICLQSSGVTLVQRSGGNAVTGNAPAANAPAGTPNMHCHGKLFLKLDKRYDLKPVFFLPVVYFRVAAFPVGRVDRPYQFSWGLVAGVLRPGNLRGPPSI